MATIDYTLQRKKPYPDPNAQQPTQPGTYALQRQAPLTQGAQIAQDQNTQSLQTGKFADVQSAQNATERANALRTSNALQDARGTFARSNADYSPEAAARAQDQAFSAAEAQNLNGTNAVNQLQRQYRTDAQNNANTYENQAQQVAQGQQAYLTNRYDTNQANTESARRYDLTRGDQNSQFATTAGMNQQQINNQASQFGQSLGQRDKEFGVTAGQNQQQINNQVDQFGRSLNQNQGQFDATLGQRNKEFGVTSNQDWTRITNQANQFDQSLNQNQNQFNVTSGQNQQQINNQASQFGQTYAAGREDAATQKQQFGVTSNQNQQQINNQASQAAAQLGYNYATLSQADKQYFQSLAQRQSEFGVTSGQQQQQIDNQASQFGVTSGMTQQQINNQAAQFQQNYGLDQTRVNNQQNQYDLSRADQNSQFATTAGMTQQQIDAQKGNTAYSQTMDKINSIADPKAKQAAYNAYMNGQDVSQFITGTLYDSKGGLNTTYASASPAQQALQSRIDELKVLQPLRADEKGWTKPEDQYNAEIARQAQQELRAADAIQNSPNSTATTAQTVQQAMQNLANGNVSSDALKALPAVTAQSIPLGSQTANYLAASQSGGWTNISGKPYKVVSGGNTTPGKDSGDYAVLQDQSGKTMYLLRDGSITATQPKPAATNYATTSASGRNQR